MREIKFRGWDESDNSGMYNHIPVEQMIKDGITVMQYTGLKDKNGKDIYEGDVLMFRNNNPVEVSFSNGCFNVFDEPLGWSFDEGEDCTPIKTDTKYCEIIGNIHENPELI